eukprot:gnl/Chilomastix_cuspidata/4873.p1 GENE.gnl/Chilomastix_cuspidata/4873~~gnl/Chilomastix_cuspidata/4873.p1  ORF type:complete len:205 (+),score=107.79 gnl/Chilomastix_cuspidata/4873:185-799(+)
MLSPSRSHLHSFIGAAFGLTAERVVKGNFRVAMEDFTGVSAAEEFRRGAAQPHWLADALLGEFPRIKAVRVEPDGVAIKADDRAWRRMEADVLAFLEGKVGDPRTVWDRLAQLAPDSPTYAADVAHTALKYGVSPFLERDGGFCEFAGLEFVGAGRTLADPVEISVRLGGACAGCPMAGQTLRTVVEESLRQLFPALVAVRPVE